MEAGRRMAGWTNMGNYKPCVDCGKSVVLGVRKGNICLDCLIIRMAEVLPPTKRKKFLKGVFQQEDIGPKAQEKPPEAPKDAGPGPS
jgi:hypothetical protein